MGQMTHAQDYCATSYCSTGMNCATVREKPRWYLLALAVTLLALVGLLYVLLFTAKAASPQPQQTLQRTQALSFYCTSADALSGFTTLPAATTNSESDKAVLDNDRDNDGNLDGLSDPLIELEVLSVLAVLVSGRLLLAFYNLAKPSSVWQLLLERPG